MVRTLTKSGKKYFQCEECGFYYLDNDWAEKCEDFCKNNKSCSTNITKHSVEI